MVQYPHYVVITVAVVIAFFLCWAPFQSQRLMTLYIPLEDWTPQLHMIQTTLFYISGNDRERAEVQFVS